MYVHIIYIYMYIYVLDIVYKIPICYPWNVLSICFFNVVSIWFPRCSKYLLRTPYPCELRFLFFPKNVLSICPSIYIYICFLIPNLDSQSLPREGRIPGSRHIKTIEDLQEHVNSSKEKLSGNGACSKHHIPSAKLR